MEVKYAETFKKWFGKLKDRNGKAAILRRLFQISVDNFGDKKYIESGISELRIHSGYRVYFCKRESCVMILVGGNKDSQQRDIQKALKIKGELSS